MTNNHPFMNGQPHTKKEKNHQSKGAHGMTINIISTHKKLT